MATTEQRRHPIGIAAELAQAGRTEVAQAIIDLLALANAQAKLLAVYRLQGRPAGVTLETIGKHGWMLD